MPTIFLPLCSKVCKLSFLTARAECSASGRVICHVWWPASYRLDLTTLQPQ